MKKFIIIAIIGLLGFAALLGSTEEDIPEETEADTKAEETSDKDDNKAQSETTEVNTVAPWGFKPTKFPNLNHQFKDKQSGGSNKAESNPYTNDGAQVEINDSDFPF